MTNDEIIQDTAKRLIADGRLPATRAGSTLRVRAEDFETLLAYGLHENEEAFWAGLAGEK
ncbi:MAG: hypothetical protein ABI592_01135 [Acidobacteriota bacterium]